MIIYSSGSGEDAANDDAGDGGSGGDDFDGR